MICEKCKDEIPNFLEDCPKCSGNDIKFIYQNSNVDTSKTFYLANNIKRLLNFFFDTIVIIIIIRIFGYWLWVIENFLKSFNIPLEILNSIIDTIRLALIILLSSSYYIFLETIFGRTIGKFITQTRVIRQDGANPTIIDIFVRTVLRFIPLEAISFFRSQIGWHDYLSGTIVVFEKKNDNILSNDSKS